MEKTFKTIEEQINILENKGLLINDKDKATDIFINNNYYYLINGYKELFANQNKYKVNVSLQEIYSLYKFDSYLRIIFLKYIFIIERKVNTYISYEFSKSYGHKNYLLQENFDNTKINVLNIFELINHIQHNWSPQHEC